MTPQDRLAASRAAMVRTLAPAAPRDRALADWAPAALQNPWTLLGTAALAGAALVALRPWRWLPSTPVLVALVARAAWRSWNRPPRP